MMVDGCFLGGAQEDTFVRDREVKEKLHPTLAGRTLPPVVSDGCNCWERLPLFHRVFNARWRRLFVRMAINGD